MRKLLNQFQKKFMNNFLKILEEKSHILADGATGTNLFAMGLETGDPPEPWNIEYQDRIRSLHQGFVDFPSSTVSFFMIM